MTERSEGAADEVGVSAKRTNFCAELRRRNVIRMAGLYLVGAWLALQVAETLLPIFDTPGWVLKAVVGVLALGFVPALALSWVFEITADGIKRESELGPAEAAGGVAMARRLDITVIILLLVAIGLILWRRAEAPAPAIATPVTASAAAAAAAPRSIAVLAFDDLSAEGDQAYFAEGVSEELLNLLARIDGLKVAARTSSFKFKDGKADIGEIGRALHVDTVLEGSVRKAGDQVRITAQLIRVADGFHIWSESYNRRLDNIFAVQDEIAQAIVAALKLKLDLARETAGRTENLEAYDLYLRGRQQARAPTREGLQQAIVLFEQALAIDPGYAAAHSGIAEAWIWLEDYGGFRSTEAFPKAEQAAQRALALDPDSPEANAAMAFVQDRYYSDLQQAQTLFDRALAINPNYVIAYNMYADSLRDMGQPRRMVEVQRRSVELDPLSTFFRARLASRLMDTGAVAESEQLIQALLGENPDSDFALEELANLRRKQGRMADAAALYRRVHISRPGDPFSAAQIAMLGARLDDAAMADAWVAAARARGENNRWELQAREMIAVGRGDWPALDAIGTRLGGERGAYLRGVAAVGQQRWPDARQAVTEALRLGGYREGQALFLQNIQPLLLLAWLERRDQQPGWQPRLAAAEAFLQRAEAEGGLDIDISSTRLEQARAAALAGERERSLGHLRIAISKMGYRDHWFLARDPLFAAWRDDAEFTALVATMRAKAEAERKQVAADGLQRPESP